MNSSHVCAYHCAQQHSTGLISFLRNLQTTIMALMLSIGGEGIMVCSLPAAKLGYHPIFVVEKLQMTNTSTNNR